VNRGPGLGAIALAVTGAFLTIAPERASSAPELSMVALEWVAAASPARSQQTPADTVVRHDQHTRVACLSCHSMDPSHGDVRIRSLADCRSCHHAREPAPDCASCHEQADAPRESLALLRTLSLSTGPAPERTVAFAHAQHTSVSCGSCHTGGLALSASAATCDGCHVEHHRPEARCATCHVPVLEPPHEVSVHVGCAGTTCHASPGFQVMPRGRASCVACHREEEEHKPGRECTACHLLPPPRPPGGDP
jgi:hypothetical protein